VCATVCAGAVGQTPTATIPSRGLYTGPAPTVLLYLGARTAYSWTGGRMCTTPPHPLLDNGSRIPPAGCVGSPHSKSNQDATNYCRVYFYSHFSSCCLRPNSINPEIIRRTAQNTCSSIRRYTQPLLAHTYNANHTTQHIRQSTSVLTSHLGPRCIRNVAQLSLQLLAGGLERHLQVLPILVGFTAIIINLVAKSAQQ
jgi:hypothetical protein